MAKIAEFKIKVNNRNRLISELDSRVDLALDAAGTVVADFAAMNLERNPRRVDTGALKNSINHEVDKSKKICYVGTNKEYAVYVEYGTGKFAEGGNGRKTPWMFYYEKIGEWVRTSGMKPNHFLRDAMADHKTQIKDLMKEILNGQY